MTSGYDYKKFALLFVDDEEQARKYFQMAFENDFRVVTAPGVDAAWSIVDAADPPVGVVITDQRMPDRTGTELLARVRRAHPEIVRLLATAYSDLGAAIDAVNDGAIFKYVVKPWDVRELRVTLRHAMEYFLLRRERDLLLREKLSSLQSLLVADRVKSLAILAEGLSTQVRNTMSALQAYVALVREQSLGEARPSPSVEERWRNLQWETEDATGHLLKIVQGIAVATLEPHHDFSDQVPLADLVEEGWADARAALGEGAFRLALDIDPELPSLGCSRAMLKRMFACLLRTLLRDEPQPDASASPVQVIARERTRLWGADSVVIDIVRQGFVERWQRPLLFPANGLTGEDDSPDLLAAFFIVHHHGGVITLELGRPTGSGFRLTLPFSPESIERPTMDADAGRRLFADLPRWEALERSS
jgi:two-component system, probable response regulator PhcQ